jgi:hypothetical protein
LIPCFFCLRYRIRFAEVSFINNAAKAIGAATIMITHIDHLQSLSYSLIMYAPMRGPRAGPKKGEMTKNNAALPWLS